MPLPQQSGVVKGLIYPVTGPAASEVSLDFLGPALARANYRTVVVLAPSADERLVGATVNTGEVIAVPWGEVAVSPKAQVLAGLAPFSPEPQSAPACWPLPRVLQSLGDFGVVPIRLGQAAPEQVAQVLGAEIGHDSLVIACNLGSAPQPAPENAVAASAERLSRPWAPVLVLRHLAGLKGWVARRLAASDGPGCPGRPGEEPGLTVLVYCQPDELRYSPHERELLLRLARQALQEAVRHGGLPPVHPQALPPRLHELKACFVTLTAGGRLRGCIGHLAPQAPLYLAVLENTRNAALRDCRFPPVQPEEVNDIRIEISVLTQPQPLRFSSPEELLDQLRPREDGVILHLGDRRATFLPQVWEQLPDKVDFLNRLAIKAGGSAHDWRLPGTRVETYQVEAFHEGD